MSFSREKCLAKFVSVFFLVLFLLSVNIQAQKKRAPAKTGNKSSQTASKKQSADKKTATNNKKSAVNDKKTTAKDKKSAAANDKKSAKNDRKSSAKDKKDTSTDKKNDKKTAKNKADLKKDAESKRLAKIEAEKQRAAEQARRQAALEEKRRREQAAREARERKLAFERGLRTETVENIINDNTEGEDLEVRRAAVKALGNRAGTVVVMEPQTGKVLTIVNQDWAIRKGFKPCSTIKLVTAIAGIEEKVIADDGNIKTRNFPMNLDDALAFSNNSYFQTVGSGVGNEKMISYAQKLGLGQQTGINADGETSGRLPFGNNNARIYSHGDDFKVTPLQLAVLVSAISNGGKLVVPKVPRTKIEQTNFRGQMRREVNLPKKDLQGVIPGMVGAASYGTARRGVDSSLEVAGKTGSCIDEGSWVGLFASVAPIENPQLAIVVITRGQGERGKFAAAVAGSIYDSLRNRFNERGDKNLAKLPLELKPQPKVNAQTSAKIDTDEGEDSDEGDALTAKGKKGGADTTSNTKTAVKNNKTPAQLFPPIVVDAKKLVKKTGSSQMSRPRVVTNP